MASMIRSHYDPVAEFERLFDDAFNTRFRSPTSSAQVAKRPGALRLDSFRPKSAPSLSHLSLLCSSLYFSRIDIHESSDSNTVTATLELPGLQSEDIAVDIYHNRLTVSGQSPSNSQEEGTYAVRERHYGKFSRTLQLPLGTKVSHSPMYGTRLRC